MKTTKEKEEWNSPIVVADPVAVVATRKKKNFVSEMVVGIDHVIFFWRGLN